MPLPVQVLGKNAGSGMGCCTHFQPAFRIKGKSSGTKYHKKDQANQNQNRYLQFHQVSEGKKAFWIVDKHNGSDQDRNLDKADDAREQSHRDKWSAKNVSKHDVVGQRRTCEIDVNTGSGHLEVVHMRKEIQALVGDKNPQGNPENIKKSGPMGVSPFFDIADDTHSQSNFVYNKVYEIFLAIAR